MRSAALSLAVVGLWGMEVLAAGPAAPVQAPMQGPQKAMQAPVQSPMQSPVQAPYQKGGMAMSGGGYQSYSYQPGYAPEGDFGYGMPSYDAGWNDGWSNGGWNNEYAGPYGTVGANNSWTMRRRAYQNAAIKPLGRY